MIFRKRWCALLLPFLTASALAAPAQIVIIRHGEKPLIGNQLNAQGCERAFSLPHFFQNDPAVNRYGKPVAIYAMSPHNSLKGSQRPIQTVVPTAAALDLSIQNRFTRLQYKQITEAVMQNPAFDGKTVIISWEHTAIPGLAEAFGLQLPASARKWKGHTFDEAWVISFGPQGRVKNFEIVPEKALPTDNPRAGLKDWNKQPKHVDSPCLDLPQNILNECANNDLLNSMMPTLLASPL